MTSGSFYELLHVHLAPLENGRPDFLQLPSNIGVGVAEVALIIFLLLRLLLPEDILDLGVEGGVSVLCPNMISGLEGSQAGFLFIEVILSVRVDERAVECSFFEHIPDLV